MAQKMQFYQRRSFEALIPTVFSSNKKLFDYILNMLLKQPLQSYRAK